MDHYYMKRFILIELFRVKSPNHRPVSDCHQNLILAEMCVTAILQALLHQTINVVELINSNVCDCHFTSLATPKR